MRKNYLQRRRRRKRKRKEDCEQDVRGKGRRAARVAVADETTTIEEKRRKSGEISNGAEDRRGTKLKRR